MKRDHRKEFLEAYELYAEAIWRHGFFRIFSEERAEELMQETFMRTWRYLRDGNTIANLRAFLYQTLRNLIVDDARRKKEASLDKLMETSDAAEPSYDAREDIERQVLLSHVREVITKLPEEDRELVILRYVDDLPPREIGEVLGMSVNNVSVRLHRIVETLRDIINPPLP
jgi:RNA polymerase sigma-70 factor (ECF subfamily)